MNLFLQKKKLKELTYILLINRSQLKMENKLYP